MLNGVVQGVPSFYVFCKRVHTGSGAQESLDALEVVEYNRQVQGRVKVSAARKSALAALFLSPSFPPPLTVR